MVQLRDDVTPGRRAGRRSRGVWSALLAPTGVPLIVNNRVEVALAAGAAGVHVGQADASPAAGAWPARARSHRRAEHHRAGAGRGRRSAAWSTIWASARFSPPRPSPTRPRRWGWPAWPPSAPAPPCRSSPSAASTRGNAAAVIAAGADGDRRRVRGVRRGRAARGGAGSGVGGAARARKAEREGDGRRMAGGAVRRRAALDSAARLALPAASAGSCGPDGLTRRDRGRHGFLAGYALRLSRRQRPRAVGGGERRFRARDAGRGCARRPVRPGRADGAAGTRTAGSRHPWSSSPASRAGWAR